MHRDDEFLGEKYRKRNFTAYPCGDTTFSTLVKYVKERWGLNVVSDSLLPHGIASCLKLLFNLKWLKILDTISF